VSPAAGYQAGARGWLWIKLKRDYRTELSDTIDLVVVGAFAGRGRRRGLYGALLLAAYDPAADVFRAVTKCGTGFSDADLAALPARLAPLARPQRPARAAACQEPATHYHCLKSGFSAAWASCCPNAGSGAGAPRCVLARPTGATGRGKDCM
jgi:ATP-dependent DNA ligase